MDSKQVYENNIGDIIEAYEDAKRQKILKKKSGVEKKTKISLQIIHHFPAFFGIILYNECF